MRTRGRDAKKLAAVLILGTLQISNGFSCPPGTYWDHVTEGCDPCADICEFKELMRTVDECKSKCPDYRLPSSIEHVETTPTVQPLRSQTTPPTARAPSCGEGQAYVKTLERCEDCVIICNGDRRHSTECEITCSEKVTERQEDKEDSIALSLSLVFIAVILVSGGGLLVLVRQKRTRPRSQQQVPEGSSQNHKPHPTVTYVPVPVHAQCVDSVDENHHVIDGCPTEEVTKFPRSVPDLPSTAHPVTPTILNTPNVPP